MRLTELTGKEVINLGDGGRLGTIDDCEIIFDPAMAVFKRWCSAIIPDFLVSLAPGARTIFPGRRSSASAMKYYC